MNTIKITNTDIKIMVTEAVKKCLTEMVAYHGGCKLFNRFDLSKAHTGEGATMYGFGVYVTSNIDTGKHYMKVIANTNNSSVGYLYEVEIPDDNGKNYLNIQKNNPQVYDYLEQGLIKLCPDMKENIIECLDYCRQYDTLMWLFQSGCGYSFDEVELAQLLMQLGFVGVRVPVGYREAGMGQLEGYNYTIFNDNNVKIVNVEKYNF